MGDVIYEINPNLCTECVGHHDKPQCQLFCPVDCIPLDPNHAETREELQAKYEKLTAQKHQAISRQIWYYAARSEPDDRCCGDLRD